MTGARQPEKARALRGGLFGLVLAAFGILFGYSAAAEQPLVVNADTGLALSGVDPVAYFTDRKPVFGRPDLELGRFGAVWRFRNPGNRDAFVANPEVYMPQFGGYDPVAIERGRAVPGHPLIWTVTGDRLYLFYSDADRAAFIADADRIVAAATRKWPDVARAANR
ncbi:YHS domain-containing (seleno)protein [Pseudolabrys taiwanensis]|uniref:YHS domain-containing (seleno)protein n=1 Tax=Pseudolabrys taiwanensis TaxID=331696 RepID=UPI001AECC806|nr:YHS domain-containing (seleno)protein [Pseudolabrys taiwanensis]